MKRLAEANWMEMSKDREERSMRARFNAVFSTCLVLVGLVVAGFVWPTSMDGHSGLVSAQPLDPTLESLMSGTPDPTLQALATEAVAVQTEVAGLPTPNPTDMAQALTQAGAITIQGTLSITGAVEVSGPYTLQLLNLGGIRPDYVSCAAFAQGQRTPTGGSGFRLPDPPMFGTTFGGHTVLAPVEVSPYPGPGSYARNAGVQLGPGVVLDDTSYNEAAGPDYQVSVNADGSGTFTFTNLHAPSGTGDPYSGPAISGSMSWTCSQ